MCPLLYMRPNPSGLGEITQLTYRFQSRASGEHWGITLFTAREEMLLLASSKIYEKTGTNRYNRPTKSIMLLNVHM